MGKLIELFTQAGFSWPHSQFNIFNSFPLPSKECRLSSATNIKPKSTCCKLTLMRFNTIDDFDDDEARNAEERYDEIEALIEAMQKSTYNDDDKARCGVFLYVNNGGDLVVGEGFVNPADTDGSGNSKNDDTDELDDYCVALERMQGDCRKTSQKLMNPRPGCLIG